MPLTAAELIETLRAASAEERATIYGLLSRTNVDDHEYSASIRTTVEIRDQFGKSKKTYALSPKGDLHELKPEYYGPYN